MRFCLSRERARDSADWSADQSAGGAAGAVEGASRKFTFRDRPSAIGIRLGGAHAILECLRRRRHHQADGATAADERGRRARDRPRGCGGRQEDARGDGGNLRRYKRPTRGDDQQVETHRGRWATGDAEVSGIFSF